MQQLPPGVFPGAEVRARGERWRVRHTRSGDTAALVTLDGLDGGNRRHGTTLIVPFDCLWPVAERLPTRRRRLAVAQGMLVAIARACPAQGLWTAAAARMDVLPWQLAPALAVVQDGASRLLLADAVGLGKTVQAGLILAELRARGLVDRALVLAPAAIRAQWAEELQTRFALPARVLDLPTLLELGATGPARANPWSRAPIIVSSIDLVKRADVRAAVEHAPLDLLIVDEAHHATPGTDRLVVVDRLAQQAPWVVLVSATPHSGDVAAYEALLAVGSTPAREPMRVFRRTHAEVAVLAPRRTRTWHVSPSPEEAYLHDGVLAYARRICRGSASPAAGLPLVAATLARRATSSARAVRLTLERRLVLLSGSRVAAPETDSSLPWEETDPEEAETPWLAVAGFTDQEEERGTLADLIARAAAAERAPSKIARLQRFIRRLREPAIVFSEFRDTLEALRPSLEAVASVACLHGDLDVAERHRQLTRFLDGRARVLLTTDVAGEGLNLHRSARLVITMEWPWSPLRLEQRIGRVHRLGQPRAVHAVHLTASRSYEDLVMAHVAARASRAAAALTALSGRAEETVASLVLGWRGGSDDLDSAARPVAVDSPLAPTEFEARRIARIRALVEPSPASPHGAVWCPPARGRPSSRAVVLVEVTHQLPFGVPRGTQLVAVIVLLHHPVRDRKAWRDIVRRLARDPRVHQAATDAAAAEGRRDQWSAVRERLRASRDVVGGGRPRAEVQPSLFDRRALQSAERQQDALAAWERWHEGVAARLAPGPLHSLTRIRAVLPLDWPER